MSEVIPEQALVDNPPGRFTILAPAPTPDSDPRPRRLAPRLVWLLLPVLALVAYAPVLGVGFLSDDYVLLYGAKTSGFTVQALLPQHDLIYYRPVGVLLTWNLGWQLWGFAPWPYHAVGLLLHAGTALVLGLWCAEVSGRRLLGWLAGALFAVFPLHMEATGWLAAQWDLWAAGLGITGLWLFTRWWRRGGPLLYVGGVLGYGLGLFSKESLLSFLPMFALAAVIAGPRFSRRCALRLVYALLPFALLLALNVGLRLAVWGRLGSYPQARADYPAFFWDSLLTYIHLLLAPVSTAVFGPVAGQVAGLLSSVGLALGLVWYGRRQGRWLLLAAAWVILALLPVLNLQVNGADLENNRFLYLASAGYCVGVAALLYPVLVDMRRRAWAWGGLGLAGLLCAAIAWGQIGPWQEATGQAAAILQDLRRLIPPQPARPGITWYVETPPDSYKGAYIFRQAIGWARYFADGEDPTVRLVPAATDAPLAGAPGDAFSLRFRLDPAASRYVVDYAAGVTEAQPPPNLAGAAGQVWDFRTCSGAAQTVWQPHHMQITCLPGTGLALRPTGTDPQLEQEALALDPAGPPARYLRLRVAARYAAVPGAPARLSQWFWRSGGAAFSGDRTRVLPIRADGATHVYWTYIPAGDVSAPITGLRLDPIDAATPATLEWIALDRVP